MLGEARGLRTINSPLPPKWKWVIEHLLKGRLTDTLFDQVLQRYQLVLDRALLVAPAKLL
jgi:hypothetical protein